MDTVAVHIISVSTFCVIMYSYLWSIWELGMDVVVTMNALNYRVTYVLILSNKIDVRLG